MRGLIGKVALVTGSTRGIGEAIATRLAEEGVSVVVTGRDVARGNEVAAAINASGGSAVFLPADLSDEDQVRRLVDGVIEQYGALHILVNNAAPVDQIASGSDQRIVDVSTEAVDRLLRTGLYGPFWCCKYAIPHLEKTPGSAIVNITSIVSFRGKPAMPVYSMMKGAINSLTRQLAVDFAPTIRVNCIVVGPTTGTETTDSIIERGSQAADAWRNITLTRFGNVRDIAAAAAFLASDDSAATTGSFVFCEGGQASWNASPDMRADQAVDTRWPAARQGAS